MFLVPLSLQNISQLRNPSERVPLSEQAVYKTALLLIEGGGFDGFELHAKDKLLQLQVFWKETGTKGVTVQVTEDKLYGPLTFSCSVCNIKGRAASSCPHQWASYVLLWQALAVDDEEIVNADLRRLSDELKGPKFLGATDEDKFGEFTNVVLDSVSLFIDERPLFKGGALSTFLSQELGTYEFLEVTRDKELLSPRLWNLPEVFRKKLGAFSEHYFNEVNRQNRMADLIRYNFSNGMQISSKEILRHPLHRKVPLDLLPQGIRTGGASAFSKWPLIQKGDSAFTSQALAELEEIMQNLLSQVAFALGKGKLKVFLQNKNYPTKALPLTSVEYDPSNEIDWRVDFTEKSELESQFKLVSFRKQPLYFYESFAIEPVNGVILVHPWLQEFSLLQEFLTNLSNSVLLMDKPTIDLTGEYEAKALLKYLRTRPIPVKITGDSRTLEPHQSLTEIRLNEVADFYIQHDGRVTGQKNLQRRGWSTRTMLYMQALSHGVTFLLNNDAKDLAARTGSKRDWDLKLLKHLGILQYLLLEILSFHFDGQLIDETVVKREELFSHLHEKVKALLIAGSSGTFVQDMKLSDICSKTVLNCFEEFVRVTLKSMETNEAFYSEQGEVVLEGVIEREFRLIYALLKRMALGSNGEVFKKSRTSFLSRIARAEKEEDILLNTALFRFSPGEGKMLSSLQDTLEALQPLIPHGFKIFYKDQPLQELAEDEFRVDFVLETDGHDKIFNWFELNPKFFLRGEEVDPDQFLKLGGGGVIEYEGKLFLVPRKQMPTLKRLENFWQKLQKGKVETQKKKNGDNVYQLPRHQTLELLALRQSGIAIRGDEEWKKLCDFYDNLGKADKKFKMPETVNAELKPYQEIGVQWLQDLYNLRLGALLADDMGLGKTLQTLTFLEDLRTKEQLGQVLIVVPSSLVYNWQSEVEKFTPNLPLTIFSNKDSEKIYKGLGRRDEMVVVVTYGLLMEHEASLNQYKWKVIVFDEAQNLKNITTKRTSAARSLTGQFKVCLTGTPMENHYGEFYSLVDILVPGSLGRMDDFRREFVNSEMITREQMEDLKLKIKPLMLRRTKKEILDQLPEKQETKISIAFEDRQKEIYRDIALSYNQRVQETMEVQGEASVQLQMLTALLRLRQVCSDPAALPNVRYDKVPPKLETLLDSVHEIVESGESALVFTQFLQTLEHTEKILKQEGIPVFVLHGGVPTKQRQKILADFNNSGQGAVLVMTLKTGGVGLNLTKASYVFHLEPWWNPSVENQATDRAHRLGQSKAVQVFRYIMHESLEEKIELLKSRKERKFQALLTTAEKVSDVAPGDNSLSKEDFDFLLGLK